MEIYTILPPCFILSFLLSHCEAAVGEKYPYIANAVLGRGIDKDTGTVKEMVLKRGFLTKSTKVTKSVTKYSFIEDDSDVSKLLDVGGQLQFGINAGFTIKVDGRANYVDETGKGNEDVHLMFSINVLDYYEMVPFIESEGRTDCKEMTEDAQDITHVVGGILHGAQCIISIVWKAKNSKERRDIMGELNLKMGMKGKMNIEVGGKVTYNNSAEKAVSNYDMKSSCNMEIEKFPTDMESITKFAYNLPRLYAEANASKRGTPLSMFLVPIAEVEACKDLPEQNQPGVFSASSLLEVLFVEMENMLKDFEAAKDNLMRCQRSFPMGSVVSDDVDVLESAFYHMFRAMGRRVVFLKEELMNARGKDVKWDDPQDLTNFTQRFEQQYFDFVVVPVSKSISEHFTAISDGVRFVEEGDKLETTLKFQRQLVGNKVWRTRVEALCNARRKLSAEFREEF